MEEQTMKSNLEINKKKGFVIVSVNPKIYPLDVVMSAAYIFTDKCYVLVDGDLSEEIIVELRPKDKQELEDLGRDFNNELVNYATYAIQTLKNENLRQAIINRVLLTNSDGNGVSLSHSETDNDKPKPWETEDKPWEKEDSSEDKPWFDDPEGIAVPWEEKYGKDKDN